MISFRQFCEMAERSKERAQKLLKYVHKKQEITGIAHIDRALRPFHDQMQSIIPQVKHIPLPRNFSYEDFHRIGEVRDVPVKSIVGRQSHVSKTVVSKKIDGSWTDHMPEIPQFIHHKGVHYQMDGHHRANQARFEGKTNVKGVVIDAGDDPRWL